MGPVAKTGKFAIGVTGFDLTYSRILVCPCALGIMAMLNWYFTAKATWLMQAMRKTMAPVLFFLFLFLSALHIRRVIGMVIISIHTTFWTHGTPSGHVSVITV